VKKSAGLSLLLYSVLRLAAFLVPFGLLMLLPAFHDLWWLAAVFAALIGLSVSVLFLRRPLSTVSETLVERRAERTKSAREIDDEIEDEANERALRDRP